MLLPAKTGGVNTFGTALLIHVWHGHRFVATHTAAAEL
jgi:hypothetical protein